MVVNLLNHKDLESERPPIDPKGRILKSVSVVAFVTAISRFCRHLRDQRVAILLGTSPAAHALILAFRIADLVRRIIGGTLSASFIPLFTGCLREKPHRGTMALRQNLFWDIGVVVMCPCVGLAAVAPEAIEP